MSTDAPSAYELWRQAGGDSARYRELMHSHGLILRPGDEGYEQASRTLPCGWPGPQKPASEWCIHDMPPGTCSMCTGRGEEVPEVRDKANLGYPLAARYPGKCGWCGDQFAEGEQIRRDRESGTYICEECGS
jgi:hypothetical protein